MTFYYKTINGNVYPIDFFSKSVKVKDLVYDPQAVRDMCRTGCNNFGRAGGCPPRAPLMENLFKEEQKVYIIVCRFDSKFKPEKVRKSNNIAVHWKFQDGILARVLNKLGHSLSQSMGGCFLATGYCMGCPGKKCTFKLGMEECRNPQKRTYSMEATGIDVVKTIKKIFDMDLYWYRKGMTDVPYMMKSIAFFPETADSETPSLEDIIDATGGRFSLSH